MNVAELLVPDFALIALGFLLRRHGGFSDEFWRHLERLVYYVLFPALLFGALARGRIEFASAANLVTAGLAFTAAGIMLGWAARWLFAPPRMVFASGVQCAYRFNSYIGFAIAGGLHGLDGVAAIGLLVGFLVPSVNVIAVWTLARHGDGDVLREVARNPLILATVSGLLWAALGLPLPAVAGATLHFIGEAALPIGLIAVGAGLTLNALTHHKRFMAWLVAVKLVAVPAVAWLAVGALGLEGVYRDVAMILAALPTASSAYILAARMGGDGRIVASVMALNILGAIVTLPLWLSLLVA